MVNIGVAWCTHFRRRGLTFYNRLSWGYRAAGLFAGTLRRPGTFYVQQLACDEDFEAANFDGRQGRAGDGLDVLYAAAHGELRGGEFKLILHDDEWRPSTAGLDGSGPRVAVFDACNLVDLQDMGWAAPWTNGSRPKLRLLCGFASTATVGKGPTGRGHDFAALVEQGEPVATAWLRAVVDNGTWLSRDVAVAIGFGTTPEDAASVLDASLDKLLAMPTVSGAAVTAYRKATR